jgi:hypothetical protein
MALDPTRSAAFLDNARDVLAALRTPYANASHARGGFFPVPWNRATAPTDGTPAATNGDTGAFFQHGTWSERGAQTGTDPLGNPIYATRAARGVTWAQARTALSVADRAKLDDVLRRARVCLQTYGPNDADRPFHPDSAGLVLIAQMKDAAGVVYEARRGWGIASGETRGFVAVPAGGP